MLFDSTLHHYFAFFLEWMPDSPFSSGVNTPWELQNLVDITQLSNDGGVGAQN